MPDARAVRNRLSEVIVGANDIEKRLVMQLIKRVKPFTVEHDVDTSISLHLKRCLTDIQQQESEFDHILALNIIKTIINASSRCQVMNEVTRESEDEDAVSVYDRLVPLIAAVLLRIPAKYYKQTEQMLFCYLMDTDMIRVSMVSDIWCILCRASEPLQQPLAEFLFLTALSFEVHDIRRYNIHSLLRRMMRFMDSECHSFLTSRYDPAFNSFDFALQYLSEEKKAVDLNRLVENIFNSDSCVLSHVESACQLLALVSQPDESMVVMMRDLVTGLSDGSHEPGVRMRIRECERVLSLI